MDQDTHRSPDAAPDQYEWLDEIGSGGLGTVYQGCHLPLDRRVAIKEISNLFDVFADIDRRDIVDRFRQIIRAQAALSHPAVLQIYDIDTDADYPYVVTEYAPHGSLRRLVDAQDDGQLRITLKYFIQILHGLNYAHQHGAIHGNIKPENVLLDASGNAKLCDFGLSTLVDLSGLSNQVYVGVGDVSYMAPEQFEDPNAATVQTDIYSLGIMFYEMLTGKVPGRRSPMPSSVHSKIPEKLDDIFDRMSMDEPDERYQSIHAILADFYSDEEIIDLLDRQSGVVFLRDPLEYGDDRVVDDEGEPIEVPEARAKPTATAPAASLNAPDPSTTSNSPSDGQSEVADEQEPVGDERQPTADQPEPVADESNAFAGSGEFGDDFSDAADAFAEQPEQVSSREDEFAAEPDVGGSEAVEMATDGGTDHAVKEEAPEESAADILEGNVDEIDRAPEADTSAHSSEETDRLTDATSADAEGSEADQQDGELDPEDDEVLDKLDEYGDMFE